MKNGTVRTLGTAALGAAFVAVAAGSASAAETAAPLNATPTNAVTGVLGKVTGLLPGVGQAVDALQGTVRNTQQTMAGQAGNNPLLGGLPVGATPATNSLTGALGGLGH